MNKRSSSRYFPDYFQQLRDCGLDAQLWPSGMTPVGQGLFTELCPIQIDTRSIETAWGWLRFSSGNPFGRLCRTISVGFNAARDAPAEQKTLWIQGVILRLGSTRLRLPECCQAISPSTPDAVVDAVVEFNFWGEGVRVDDCFTQFCDWVEEGWLDFIETQVSQIIGKNPLHIVHEIEGGDLVYVNPVTGHIQDLFEAGKKGGNVVRRRRYT
jgi:hypothetical protein